MRSERGSYSRRAINSTCGFVLALLLWPPGASGETSLPCEPATLERLAAAPGVATSRLSSIPDNLALLTSDDDGRGRLRAFDLRIACGGRPARCLRWEAAELLARRSWRERVLLIGRVAWPAADPGRPLLLSDGNGRLDLQGLQRVWPAAPGKDLATLVQRLARAPLAPLVGTPAVVGPPPAGAQGGEGFAAFRKQHAGRRPLIYAASTDGWLHAFDLEGREVFAYLPVAVLGPLRAALARGEPLELGAAAPRVADHRLDGRWRTLLVHGVGRRRDLIDVSDPLRCGAAGCRPGVVPLRLLLATDAPRLARRGLGSLAGPGVAALTPDGRPLVTLVRAGRRLVGRRANRVELVLDAGAGQRFVHPPAVVGLADGRWVAAAISLARTSSRIHLMDGSWRLSCALDAICSDRCPLGGAGHACRVAPPADARPVGSPLIVHDRRYRRIEVVLSLHRPPARPCRGDRAAMGDSWIVRLARQGPGRFVMLEARHLPRTRISAPTVVGIGEVALGQLRAGDDRPAMLLLSGRRLPSGTPRVETWRELP